MLTHEQVVAIESLRVKYPGNRMDKFAIDPRAHEAVAIEVARGLGLDENQPRDILDLGCGFGYFLRVCEDAGNFTSGIELPNSMIEEAGEILGVPIFLRTIRPGLPLTVGMNGFHFVTMFGVNLHDSTEYWDAHKYSFLVADIRKRLFPGGAFVIRPNAPVKPGGPTACLMDRDWWQRVAGPDAEISTTINHSFQVTIRWKPST